MTDAVGENKADMAQRSKYLFCCFETISTNTKLHVRVDVSYLKKKHLLKLEIFMGRCFTLYSQMMTSLIRFYDVKQSFYSIMNLNS